MDRASRLKQQRRSQKRNEQSLLPPRQSSVSSEQIACLMQLGDEIRQERREQQRRDWGFWENLVKEMIAIQERFEKNWMVTDYQKGQLALFEAVIVAKPNSASEEPNLDAIDIEKVKAAGQLLNESGGCRDMSEAISLWLPKSLHTFVDRAFNGIGEWKA
jgi:hypothetical protein